MSTVLSRFWYYAYSIRNNCKHCWACAIGWTVNDRFKNFLFDHRPSQIGGQPVRVFIGLLHQVNVVKHFFMLTTFSSIL